MRRPEEVEGGDYYWVLGNLELESVGAAGEDGEKMDLKSPVGKGGARRPSRS